MPSAQLAPQIFPSRHRLESIVLRNSACPPEASPPLFLPPPILCSRLNSTSSTTQQPLPSQPNPSTTHPIITPLPSSTTITLPPSAAVAVAVAVAHAPAPKNTAQHTSTTTPSLRAPPRGKENSATATRNASTHLVLHGLIAASGRHILRHGGQSLLVSSSCGFVGSKHLDQPPQLPSIRFDSSQSVGRSIGRFQNSPTATLGVRVCWWRDELARRRRRLEARA